MWGLNKVFITGATSGLGMEIATSLLHKNFQLFLSGRNKKKLETLHSMHPKKIQVHPCDLTDRYEREKLIKKAKSFSPDLVINNAGFGLYGDPLKLNMNELFSLVETNVTSVMEISIELAKGMKEGSVIVNISSVGGSMPMSGMSVYGASKAFVTSFSKALRYELEEKKIDVLTFAPGGIMTDFVNRAAKGRSYKKLRKMQRRHSMTTYFAVQKLHKQIEKRIPFFYPRAKDRFSAMFGSLPFVQRKMRKILGG